MAKWQWDSANMAAAVLVAVPWSFFSLLTLPCLCCSCTDVFSHSELGQERHGSSQALWTVETFKKGATENQQGNAKGRITAVAVVGGLLIRNPAHNCNFFFTYYLTALSVRSKQAGVMQSTLELHGFELQGSIRTRICFNKYDEGIFSSLGFS